MTRDGHVKILDFGLAKLRDEVRSSPEEAITHDAARRCRGNGTYLSPEQVRGLADAPRTSGAGLQVLYDDAGPAPALQRRDDLGDRDGHPPRGAADLPSVDRRIPASLYDRVVRRSLEKRPEDRFESAPGRGVR